MCNQSATEFIGFQLSKPICVNFTVENNEASDAAFCEQKYRMVLRDEESLIDTKT